MPSFLIVKFCSNFPCPTLSFTLQRVTDADLRALVSDEVFQPTVLWKLLDLQVI